MAKGDILFQPGSWRNAGDVAIMVLTNGRMVHCSVDMGDGTMIEAADAGVVRVARVLSGAGWARSSSALAFTADGLTAGVAWLVAQVGKDVYGWSDLPAAVLGGKLFPMRKGAYDCSHLCVSFLRQARVAMLPPRMETAPQTVSPNDLARLFAPLRAA